MLIVVIISGILNNVKNSKIFLESIQIPVANITRTINHIQIGGLDPSFNRGIMKAHRLNRCQSLLFF